MVDDSGMAGLLMGHSLEIEEILPALSTSVLRRMSRGGEIQSAVLRPRR